MLLLFFHQSAKGAYKMCTNKKQKKNLEHFSSVNLKLDTFFKCMS